MASFSQPHWIGPVSALGNGGCRHSASETHGFRSLYSSILTHGVQRLSWRDIQQPGVRLLWTVATSRSPQWGSCTKLTQAPGERERLGKASPNRPAGPAWPRCGAAATRRTRHPQQQLLFTEMEGAIFFVINKRQCLLKNKRRRKTNKMIHWDFRTHLQTQQEGKSLPLPILAAEWDQPKEKHVPTVDSLSLLCQTLRFKWPFFFGTRILAAWRMLVLNNSNTSFFLVPHRVNNANSV